MMRKFVYDLMRIFMVICIIALATPESAFANELPEPVTAPNAVLCGEGSVQDDYGFSYPLAQYHWTVDWEGYVQERTVEEVDVVLDRLDRDQIAQVMILFLRDTRVGDRVNCAVHFLRYMELGLLEGPRKDNGFVFLVVVEEDEIDVHYGVGLGLPALTAHDLTDLNRGAEDTYATTGSMDEALLDLVYSFDAYVRTKYDPQKSDSQGNTSSQPVGEYAPTAFNFSSPVTIAIVCCVLCLVFLFLMVMVSLLTRIGRRTSRRRPVFRAPRPRSRSFPAPRMPRSRPRSRPRSMPRRRGGGSGRSHRGN